MHENKEENYSCGSCGFHFLKAGLWYFIIGIIIGFGVLIHYLVGSRYNVTADFLSNITLWFGSPLSLSSAYIQLGGLGMAIVGAASLFFHRCYTTTNRPAVHTKKKGASLTLCHIGLMALFFTGYLGYFIINWASPGFYYLPSAGAKNLWLILQGLSILIYVIGLISATSCLCKCTKKHDYIESDRTNERT